MAARDYKGNAVPTTLVSTISASALSFDIAATTGWPLGGASGKFWVVFDRGSALEEKVLCLSRSGSTITIDSTSDRGLDDTAAAGHNGGVSVEHCYSATDALEANQHINNTALDHHTQYMLASGTRHDLTARHSAGSVVPTAVPVATGTALSEGGGTTLARAAHVHTIGAGSINSSGMFASSVVNNAAMADAAIGTAELIDASISTAKYIDASVTEAKQAIGTFPPIGTICEWATGTPPTNWLLLEGQAVSRTTYAALFALWGTTFGVGDGSTTFNLMDTRRRVTLGKATTGGQQTIGETGGSFDHTHALGSNGSSPGHAKVTLASGNVNNLWIDRITVTSWDSEVEGDVANAGGATVANTSGAALGGSSDTANPPYIVVAKIVRAL